MNVHTLLADATASVDTTVDPATADADLARGRHALRRRRMRSGGVAGLVAAGALAGAVLLGGADPAGIDPGAIQLVDYTGEQLAGYSVDEVPAGWTLLASTPDALTIGPAGTTDTDPSSYAGKLTVLLLSADAALPTEGSPVAVGSTDGVYVASRGVQDPARGDAPDPFAGSLSYVDPASGAPVVVQVPVELGWTPEQVADFAAGVHVTDAAERGVG